MPQNTNPEIPHGAVAVGISAVRAVRVGSEAVGSVAVGNVAVGVAVGAASASGDVKFTSAWFSCASVMVKTTERLYTLYIYIYMSHINILSIQATHM